MELPRVPRPRAGRDALADNITRQGYTFQTLLGTMGLNHMNGRVQDAISGRFISPDPFVTEPGNTQNWNRYAYVYNNPLTYVDPSGFERRCWQQQATVSFQNAPNEVTAVGITIDICAELPDIPAPNYSGMGGEHPQGYAGHGGDGGGNAAGEPHTQNPDTCKNAANAPNGLAATNKAFRNNSDPNKRFTVDASQLTVKQTTNFNSNGRAVGVVQGGDWFVHGTVTLQNSGGSISIRPEQYNFEQHDVTSVGEFFRNIETYGAYYVATFGGLSDYLADLTGGNTATDFWFDFACSPTVVR